MGGVLMAFNLPRIRNKSELQPNANKQSYVDDIFNNFFNEIASFSYPVSHGDRMLSPRTDITENESEYHLEVELPGVTQDNIDLKIDSNILTIEGKKEQSAEKKDHNYHMQERYYGSFSRSILSQVFKHSFVKEVIVNHEIPVFIAHK